MKKKKNTYLLIIAVFIIWGIVGYKMFSSLNTPESKTDNDYQATAIKPVKIDTVQKFQLKLDYRDPFLGKVKSKPKKKKIVKPKPVKPKVIFPRISYIGVLEGNGRYNFILKINNRQVIFSIADIHDDVKLISGDKEKVTVLYKGEEKTYVFKE